MLPLLYWPIFELFDKSVDDLEGPAQTLTDRANGPLDVVLLVLIVGVMARGLRGDLLPGPPAALAAQARAAPRAGHRPHRRSFFGATHFQLLQLPGLVVAGAVFGTLAYRADRLGPAIAAHLTFNMVTVIALLAA